MIQILNNGSDQYIRTRLVKSDHSGPFTGTVDGEVLPGAILIFTEFKTTPEDTVINGEDTEAVWKSITGEWQAKIPSSYITRDGLARLNISGTGVDTASIDLQVGSSGGGSTQAIDYSSYDASANQITIPGTYSLEDFTLIQNLSKGIMLYKSDPPYPYSITVVNDRGNTIVTTRDVARMSADTDVLQIYVNS